MRKMTLSQVERLVEELDTPKRAVSVLVSELKASEAENINADGTHAQLRYLFSAFSGEEILGMLGIQRRGGFWVR